MTNNSTSTAHQETEYKYESAYNASLVTLTKYPDGNTTVGTGADNVQRTYNLDGSLATMTDQNGTVHTYSYSNRRQLELDAVTTLGTEIDSAVESIGRVYDTLGRLEQVISYDDSSGTTVLNKIDYSYDPTMGSLNVSKQYHDGVSTYAAVTYTVTTDVGANYVFEEGLNVGQITYPNGAKLYQTRGNSGNPWSFNNNVDGRLKRITHLRWKPGSSAAAGIVRYKYNGVSRLVKTDYDIPDVQREMYGSTAGDYDAWDRFGRTKRQQWDKYNTSAGVRDQVDYTYDYAGNRLTRNVITSTNNTRDQKYVYDSLQRLLSVGVGTLSGSTLTSSSYKESYTLDALGNWVNHDRYSNGSSWDFHQASTHNAANEILTNGTNVNYGGSSWYNAGWVTPVHDDAGNMTTISSPYDATELVNLKYDAWNRIVEVVDPYSETITKNEYDGLNRRIKMTVGGNSYDYYYNRQWQVLEIHKDGNTSYPWKQYVYHPHYVDAIAMRRFDENTDGQNEEEHYYLQDANFNVTAVVDNMGDVEERYAYTPYGRVTFLDSSFAALSTQESDIDNDLLYTGRRRDPETGLQLNRNRFYASHLGRWVNRDPIGYRDDGYNLYAYVMNSPVNAMDPAGLNLIKKPCGKFIWKRITADGRVGWRIRFDPNGCPSNPVCKNLKLVQVINRPGYFPKFDFPPKKTSKKTHFPQVDYPGYCEFGGRKCKKRPKRYWPQGFDDAPTSELFRADYSIIVCAVCENRSTGKTQIFGCMNFRYSKEKDSFFVVNPDGDGRRGPRKCPALYPSVGPGDSWGKAEEAWEKQREKYPR